MRCLYCGEPLSLLRKLTGKAEFCSEAHRVAYQDEFNSLALQRLASQPTQSRRAKTSFTLPDPAVEFGAPPQSAEPFAGLPFPEDPDDLDPPSRLPVFDHPEPARLLAEPPAPLWGLLAGAPLDVNGETPPTYFFPILLEDYPRRYLMTNGLFPGAAVGVLPFFGYVDLPEPLNDDAGPGAKLLPEPFDAVIAWELPPGQILQMSPHELPVETRLVPFVAATFTGGYAESALAPSTCALELPEAERRRLPVLVPRSSRRLEPGSLLAQFMPPNEPMAQAGEFEPAGQGADVQYEAWCSSRLLTTANWDAFTLPGKDFAALGDQLDFDVPGLDYARRDEVAAPIPECECFDAERSLVAPHLNAGLNPSVGEAGWLEIEAASSTLSGFGWLNSAAPSPVAGELATGQLTTGQLVTGQAAPERWNVSGWSGEVSPSLAKSGLLEVSGGPDQVRAPNEPTLAADQDYLPWRIRRLSAAAAADSCCEPALAQAGELDASAVAQSGLSMELAVAARNVTRTAFSPTALAARRLPALGVAHPALLPFEGLCIEAFELAAIALTDEVLPEMAVEPEIQSGPECEPTSWISGRLAAIRRPALGPLSTLSKFRVKDFSWPEFAAGCESLFAPDQPFRFHELPFPTRGTTDKAAGDVLRCDLMQGLLLPYVDDRFGEILHPGLEAEALGDWLEETANRAGNWPSAKPKTPTAGHPASAGAGCPPDELSAPPPRPAAPKVAEPPSSWQQAARAMHEGEQQVQREPLRPSSTSSNDAPRVTAPTDEGRPVTAVPVTGEPVTGEPLSGFEVTRIPAAEPPIRFQPGAAPQNRDENRSPANDQPQFEWRREQPQQAPGFSPPVQTGSNITVNTTINVDGSGDGVVVESAIRISLGNKKKKEDALEKFSEGEDLDEQRIRIAPREDLPGFIAAAPELRAMLEPMTALSDSVQWPKFSVTPMRRRIAFGPAKTTFFGGSGSHSTPKPPSAAPNPLPPKKGVGFLFKKLTNS